VDLGEQIAWPVRVALAYPSPLDVVRYPRYSAGNTYESSELFTFFVDRRALADDRLASVPAVISWTRVGQFLPWMRMGQTPGVLVYHAAGRKLEHGFADVPPALASFVRSRAPEFEHPPANDDRPNQTSWARFRSLLDRGVDVDRCPPASAP
jgi:hypothetical protein